MDLTYLCKARRTTSLTVSPRLSAVANAACQRSSGIRIARGMSGINDLHLRVKARPSAIGEGGNWVVLRPTCDGASHLVALPSRVDDLSANPGVAILLGLACLGGADERFASVHGAPSVGVCRYRLGQSVDTAQVLSGNVRFGRVA